MKFHHVLIKLQSPVVAVSTSPVNVRWICLRSVSGSLDVCKTGTCRDRSSTALSIVAERFRMRWRRSAIYCPFGVRSWEPSAYTQERSRLIKLTVGCFISHGARGSRRMFPAAGPPRNAVLDAPEWSRTPALCTTPSHLHPKERTGHSSESADGSSFTNRRTVSSLTTNGQACQRPRSSQIAGDKCHTANDLFQTIP